MFVSREDEVRVWRGCKPEGLKRRLGGGLGEAEGPTGKTTVQIQPPLPIENAEEIRVFGVFCRVGWGRKWGRVEEK